MPTSTFYHLPPEKRQRLVEAAWQEFTRVSFADASINRIIQAARIPRGSFYQYFADKEDLFGVLLCELQVAFWEQLKRGLQDHSGDLAAALLSIFDTWFLQATVLSLPAFRAQLLLLQNPSLDWQQIVFPLRTLNHTEHIETADFFAVAAFVSICKYCLFMPEKASIFRPAAANLY